MDRRAALVTLSLCWLAGCRADLERGLAEREANEVVVALAHDGVAAEKRADEGGRGAPTYSVTVPVDDAARAVEVLTAHDLPRRPARGFAEVFGAGGLIPSATEEKARLLDALAGELARTLEAVDGVLGARVHLALPEPAPLGAERAAPPPRASVLLKVQPGRPGLAGDDVRRLVAGAVEGLDPRAVEVVQVTAPAPARAGAPVARRRELAVALGALAALALAGGALLLLALRLLRLRRELAEARAALAAQSARSLTGARARAA